MASEYAEPIKAMMANDATTKDIRLGRQRLAFLLEVLDGFVQSKGKKVPPGQPSDTLLTPLTLPSQVLEAQLKEANASKTEHVLCFPLNPAQVSALIPRDPSYSS